MRRKELDGCEEALSLDIRNGLARPACYIWKPMIYAEDVDINEAKMFKHPNIKEPDYLLRSSRRLRQLDLHTSVLAFSLVKVYGWLKQTLQTLKTPSSWQPRD